MDYREIEDCARERKRKMLITRDKQTGKLIVDFEGATINLGDGVSEVGNVGFIASLFNPDVVCSVRDGIWKLPMGGPLDRL